MDALKQWYDQITLYITDSGLRNLSEYSTDDGFNPYEKFTDVTRAKKTLRPFSYSDFKHGEEFLFISQDFTYIIAIIEILHPKINNIVRENGTYHQTLEDHLYLRYANNGFQVIYSFWDRIGDILALFFETGQTNDVYFSRVLNNFPSTYKSTTYNMLLELYNNKVKSVLEQRNVVVHTFGLKTKYRWDAVEKGYQSSDLVKLQAEKDSYPELFRSHLQFFFEGFALCMKLISELPDQIFGSEVEPA